MLDLHVDFIIQETLFGYDPAREHRAGVSGQPLFWHADVPRMKAAGYKGACLGIHYWPFETRDMSWASSA
jgi:membrane dipeptidase